MKLIRNFLIAVYVLALVVFAAALIAGLHVLAWLVAPVSFAAFVAACRVHDLARRRAAESEAAR